MKKPKPPVDLWEQLEEIEQQHIAQRPPNTFTVGEYAQKRGLTRGKARWRMEILLKKGAIERIPQGNHFLYTIAK